MTSRTKLDRRTMLRGMLGTAAIGISLPLLDVFLNDHGDALAQGSAFPKRFGIFFWGNGNLPDKWTPTTAATPGNLTTDYTLSEQLAALASVQQHLTVVSGMAVKTANTEAHGSGAAGIFTGASLLATPEGNTFAGPSIDQVMADKIGGTTRFSSIETSCDGGGSHSYNGPHSENTGETSPHMLFDKLFGPTFTPPGQTPVIDPKIALRQSVLDVVKEDAARLRPRLGANDRARLDQHLTGIRALELNLASLATPPSYAACMRPTEPLLDYPLIDARPQLSATSRAMCDILAMALACDQTRVVSHWFTRSVTDTLFPDATAGHHDLTHNEPGDQPQVNSIVKFVMGELAYMIDAFSKVQEGSETLLDHMVLFATSDCSFGRQHRLEEYPIVLAGTGGGSLKPGYYRSPSSENASSVLLSILRAFDPSVASWGDGDGKVTSGLGAIEV